MAKKAALGAITLGGSASGELRSWRITREHSEIDTTVMGSGNSRMQPGARRESIEVEAFFEYADAAQAAALASLGSETPIAVALYPRGNSSGLEVFQGDCYVMSENSEGSADGALELSLRLETDEDGGAWSTVV